LILGEPNGGEMTPTELTNDGVPSIGERVTYLNGMITTFAIIFPILFIFSHDGLRIRRVRTVRHFLFFERNGERRDNNPRDKKTSFALF
jgi:hypothetical protein